MTKRQKIIAAIEAAGGARVEPSPSRRFVAMDLNGARYWIGKLGAIRQGPALRRARRVWVLRYDGKEIARGARGGWDDAD